MRPEEAQYNQEVVVTGDQEHDDAYAADDAPESPRLYVSKEPSAGVGCFNQNAGVALRCAVCMLVIGVPLMQRRTDGHMRGTLTQTSTLYFVFSIWSNFGDTLYLVKQGFLGTIMAVLAQYILVALFHHGVDMSLPLFAFWSIWGIGVAFVVVTVWLNLDQITIMWAIQMFVFYWMEFLDPNKIPSTTEEVAYDAFGALVGGVACIAVTLLPYPLFTLWRAQDSGQSLARGLCSAWAIFRSCYCSDKPKSYQHERVVFSLRHIGEELGPLQEQLRSAWWETRLLPRWRRSRCMLGRLGETIKEASNRLVATHGICDRYLQESMHLEMHAEFMEQVQPLISSTLLETDALVRDFMDVVVSGAVASPERTERLRTRIANVQAGIEGVTEGIETVRNENPHMPFVGEHVFCLEVCAFARLMEEYATELLDGRAAAFQLPGDEKPYWGFWDVFDPAVLFGRDHLSYAFRHALKVLLGFWLGLHGLRNVENRYNAGCANVIAVMVNRHSTGSELAKNLARVQGAVLGTMIGEMANAIFSNCLWFNQLGRFVILFFLSYLFFFVYFDARRYADSYVGFIGVFFLSKVLISPCTDADFDTKQFFFTLADIVMALVIIMAVDFTFDLLDGRSAPRLAVRSYINVWRRLQNMVVALFDPNSDGPDPSADDVGQQIAVTSDCGVEAALAPRCWSAHWNADLFTQAVKAARRTHITYRSLCHLAEDGDARSKFFSSLVRLPSFGKMGKIVKRMFTVLDDAVLHEGETLVAPTDPELFSDYEREWKEACGRLLKEAEELEAAPTAYYRTLEDDPWAQLCSVLHTLTNITREIRGLHLAILEAM